MRQTFHRTCAAVLAAWLCLPSAVRAGHNRDYGHDGPDGDYEVHEDVGWLGMMLMGSVFHASGDADPSAAVLLGLESQRSGGADGLVTGVEVTGGYLTAWLAAFTTGDGVENPSWVGTEAAFGVTAPAVLAPFARVGLTVGSLDTPQDQPSVTGADVFAEWGGALRAGPVWFTYTRRNYGGSDYFFRGEKTEIFMLGLRLQ